MATTEVQILEVQNAIKRILTGGQRVKTRTAEVEMANLTELRAEQARLEQKLLAERAANSGGGLVKGYFYG